MSSETYDSPDVKIEDSFSDETLPKHKKKKAQTSKSNKRSDHKHQYEKIIIKNWGWIWGERCVICGRIKTNYLVHCPEFCKEPFCNEDPRYLRFLTVDEIKRKFIGIPIYKYNFDVPAESTHICTTLKYKDFYGAYSYSKENDIYFGKIEYIPEHISFAGKTTFGVEESFKKAVDNYIKSKKGG